MKILIVSGFLGAGKTTFIRELTQHIPGRVAILENEYAAFGIDGDILKNEQPQEQMNVWEMTEGCICCSMKKDFAASVLTIANSIDPDCLIVEPTGVGMLGAVIQNLQQIEYERITLLAPVTIVDCYSYRRYLAEYPEIYRDQIACAHTVVISKSEQASSSELGWLKEEILKINPQAEILTEHYSRTGGAFWQQLLLRRYDGTVEQLSPEPQVLPQSFSLGDIAMDCPERLLLLMEGLIHGKYGNIFRAKGIIQAGGQPFRFDLADGRYCIGGAEQANSKAVFIGMDIDERRLSAAFRRRAVLRSAHRRIPVKIKES